MSQKFVKIQQSFIEKHKTSCFEMDVGFEIKNGISCIIGNSGAGKSTILRVIAGLEKQKKNQVSINNTWQNKEIFIAPHKRKVAYAMQSDNLFTHINVEKNIKLIKYKCDEYSLNFHKVLKIEPLLSKFPYELSGGEKQRVALYKALIMDSDIILLDEPLSAIDTHHKKEILQALRKIKSFNSKPILYVSHNYDEVAQIADHIICIDTGKKIFDTKFSSDALNDYFQKNEPNQIASLFDMTIKQTNHEITTFKNNDFEILSASTINKASKNSEFRIKMLAKDISICTQQPSNTSILNIIKAKVENIIEKGQSTLVIATVGNSKIHSLISTHSFKLLEIKPNQLIWLQIKALSID